MKRIFIIFLVLLSLPALANADIERETRVLDNERGAEIRFMQLDVAIMQSELRAQRVLNYLSENYPEAEIGELEGLAEELGILRERIAELNLGLMEQGERVDTFIQIRTLANEVIREFRQGAQAILDPQDIAELRSPQAFEEDRAQIMERRQQIVQNIREYNRERVIRTLERVGVDARVDEDVESAQRARELLRERTEAAEDAQRIRAELDGERREAMQERQRAIEQAQRERERVLAERERIAQEARERTQAIRDGQRDRITPDTRDSIRPVERPQISPISVDRENPVSLSSNQVRMMVGSYVPVTANVLNTVGDGAVSLSFASACLAEDGRTASPVLRAANQNTREGSVASFNANIVGVTSANQRIPAGIYRCELQAQVDGRDIGSAQVTVHILEIPDTTMTTTDRETRQTTDREPQREPTTQDTIRR